MAIEPLHKDVTEKIIGAAFEVYRVLGYGFLEKVAKDYNPADEAQLLNELKATGIKVGLLINFGRSGVYYKHMVF